MIKVLGIPYDGNSSFLKGPSLAPPIIRQMERYGSANCFAENGVEICEGKTHHDLGDILFSDHNPESVFKVIGQNITNQLDNNDKVFCFGGDHSITFPIVDAYTDKYENLNILHLDAHADLYENFDNNPFSHASPFARILEKRKINSLTQAGIRTLNTHQKIQAEKYNVEVIEMKNFNFSLFKN